MSWHFWLVGQAGCQFKASVCDDPRTTLNSLLSYTFKTLELDFFLFSFTDAVDINTWQHGFVVNIKTINAKFEISVLLNSFKCRTRSSGNKSDTCFFSFVCWCRSDFLMHLTTEQERTLTCGAVAPTKLKHNEVWKFLKMFKLHCCLLWMLCKYVCFITKNEPKMLWVTWMSEDWSFLEFVEPPQYSFLTPLYQIVNQVFSCHSQRDLSAQIRYSVFPIKFPVFQRLVFLNFLHCN